MNNCPACGAETTEQPPFECEECGGFLYEVRGLD